MGRSRSLIRRRPRSYRHVQSSRPETTKSSYFRLWLERDSKRVKLYSLVTPLGIAAHSNIPEG